MAKKPRGLVPAAGTKIGRDGKFDFENKYTSYELGYDTITKNTDDKICYQGRR